MAVSLRRIRADLSVFGRGYLRSRVGLFFSLIFPIILILMFGAIFSGNNSGPIPVYVQNNDASSPVFQVSGGFISALNSTKAMQITLVSPGVNITKYAIDHSASAGIVIPQGFGADFIDGNPVNVTVYGNPTSSTTGIVEGVTSAVVNSFNLHRVNGTAVLGISQQSVVSKSYKYIDYLVPGLIGFSVLTSPMFALVNISSQYKRDKVFKQLSLTPLTKTEWLLSKITWYVALTVVSFVLMSTIGVALLGANISYSLGIIPFLFLGPFLFVSLGMLVGTVSKSVESAAVVGNLVTFPMMFLSGTFFPVATMPMYLQTVAHALPLFYVIDGLNNVMLYGNYGGALIDLGVLAVLSVVVFVLAVRFFKWRED
ncbi:MAG: ABC transporter permease [Nitrososphaerota archaeon]|nr:ABC transporter permease [Nitrososphaerota archaeon]MDG6967290.1 ABC transporter permease [Nitrososphaerota archaeon]MDG6977921.1 ABC transporter permease [Nitrososphaerota archaeon]MDG7020845.1 ABC transporter permease [Nitrososphaerota archaeon]MDG7022581.1 ABC transporter permease [Nitrososphaerota archaeon]